MLKTKGQEIISSWKKMASREGGNISKDFVYGNRLYEQVFQNKKNNASSRK